MINKDIHSQVDDQLFIMTSTFQTHIGGVNHYLQWEFWHRSSKSIVNMTCNKKLLTQVVSKSMNIYILKSMKSCVKNLSWIYWWGSFSGERTKQYSVPNECMPCMQRKISSSLWAFSSVPPLYLSRKVYPKLVATQRIERWIYVCIVIEQVTQRHMETFNSHETLENI